MSAPCGAGSLRSNSKMLTDLPPSGTGIVGFGYGPTARHTPRHRFFHAGDRLSAARDTCLRPLLQCLGEIFPVSLPTGDEFQPGDDLIAP